MAKLKLRYRLCDTSDVAFLTMAALQMFYDKATSFFQLWKYFCMGKSIKLYFLQFLFPFSALFAIMQVCHILTWFYFMPVHSNTRTLAISVFHSCHFLESCNPWSLLPLQSVAEVQWGWLISSSSSGWYAIILGSQGVERHRFRWRQATRQFYGASSSMCRSKMCRQA